MMCNTQKTGRWVPLFLSALILTTLGAASAFAQNDLAAPEPAPVALPAEGEALAGPEGAFVADPAPDPAMNPAADPAATLAPDGSMVVAAAPANQEINPDAMASVLFNRNEHELIKEARRSIGIVRPTTESELQQDLRNQQEEKIKPPPEQRYIRLGGIVFADGKNWTIWLNEQRVTPQALPREVLDLRVFENFIEIKWFDDYSNQIFPIRLRPHQRFNIDSRIFLPG